MRRFRRLCRVALPLLQMRWQRNLLNCRALNNRINREWNRNFAERFDFCLVQRSRTVSMWFCGRSCAERKFSKNNSPSILVPRLHLGVAQTKLVGQLHAILNAQVLLPFEALLERLQLMIGERCPGFALLFTQTRRSGEATHAAFDASTVIVFATWNEAKWKNWNVFRRLIRPIQFNFGHRRQWQRHHPKWIAFNFVFNNSVPLLFSYFFFLLY